MKLLLYDGAAINAKSSWLAILNYAVSNKLTYRAIEELISLVSVHCPDPNLCPPSLYKLKKYFQSMDKSTIIQYCSNCFGQLPDEMPCPKASCIKAKACYLALFFIEERLKQLYNGK